MTDATASRLDKLSPERRALLEKRLRAMAANAQAAQAEATEEAPPHSPAVPAAGASRAVEAALAAELVGGDWAMPQEVWRALVAAGAAEAERVALAADLVADAEMEPRHDREAVGFVAAAFRRMGALQRAGEEVTVAGLLRDHRLLPRNRKVLRRWLDMLVDEGIMARRGEVYRTVQPLSQPLAIDAAIDQARRDYYGENLHAVLTGATHPLEFYLAGGSSEGIEASYRVTPIFRYCNGIASALLAAQVAALPPERRIRLLEVGAGTGGSTASLLPLLPPERAVYLFTDVSKFFTDLGAQKFAEFPFVRYREFDLERDPVAQGLPAGCCDWLIAAHVLHATRNIHETLVHVRRLLAPGGVLLLLEETQFQRKYHFSMGFLPGFDHFEDYGLRPSHPLLSAAQWSAALRAAGFAETASFTSAGSAAEVLGVDVLIARAAGRDGAAAAAGAPARAAGARPAAPAGRGEVPSFAQQRLWQIARRTPHGTAYNVYHGVRFTGRLRPPALAVALDRLVARHEALRTRFPATEQGPLAVVDPAPSRPPALPLVDLAGLGERRARQACEQALGDQAGRPFDLQRGPLLRATLLRTGPSEHLLLLVVHHIVIDGWSLTVLVRDLAGLYAAAAGGVGGDGGAAVAAAAPPPMQAADFARRQRQLVMDGELDAELAWWRRRLAGAAPRGMRWPPLDDAKEAPGGRCGLRLDAGVSAALKALARRERVTLFVVVLAAWKALLHRRGGEDDVLVGTVVALRDRPETAELVGLLLNLLVLRTDLAGDPDFGELLKRVRETTLEALTHQRAPFEFLAAAAGAGGEEIPTPWIRGVFIMPMGEAAHAAPLRLPELEVEPALTGEMGTEFDWNLYARESEGAIQLDLGYTAGLFAPGAAAALLGDLAAMLAAVASDPGKRLSHLVLTGG